jgi:hypothetical protein
VAHKYAFNPPKIRFHFSFRKFTSNATAQKKTVQTRIHGARLTGESFLLDQSSSLILACPPRRAPGRAPGVPINPNRARATCYACIMRTDDGSHPDGGTPGSPASARTRAASSSRGVRCGCTAVPNAAEKADPSLVSFRRAWLLASREALPRTHGSSSTKAVPLRLF